MKEQRLIDFKWFVENHEDLYNKYGDSFVAIKDKKVIGVYSSYGEGVRVTSLSQELGTFIIQHCTEDDSGFVGHIYSMNF